MQTATFAAGCFWGVEAEFRRVDGVAEAAVGYMGGSLEEPTYEDVCTDTTGHAEVVQLHFDPSLVSYEELLEVFWKRHDPTQLNRQGPDFGSQYRSAIFYYSEEQRASAETSKAAQAASGRHSRPIATLIESAATFWPAEQYHQQYLAKRGLADCEV